MERKVAGVIRSLVNAKDSLQLQYARVLHEALLVDVLMYNSERMIWNGMERSSMRAAQMENLRDLLGIRRVDKCTNKGLVWSEERGRRKY